MRGPFCTRIHFVTLEAFQIRQRFPVFCSLPLYLSPESRSILPFLAPHLIHLTLPRFYAPSPLVTRDVIDERALKPASIGKVARVNERVFEGHQQSFNSDFERPPPPGKVKRFTIRRPPPPKRLENVSRTSRAVTARVLTLSQLLNRFFTCTNL